MTSIGEGMIPTTIRGKDVVEVREAMNWCKAHVGEFEDKWKRESIMPSRSPGYDCTFHFASKEDAIMFALIWS